jgi:voltage-gated potassium channel
MSGPIEAMADVPPPPRVTRGVPLLDWVMLVLALLSIGLLGWDMFGAPDARTRDWIRWTDYTLCAVFALEFAWRWRSEGWSARYLRHNWYEVLGMIPVQHPLLRAFRLFRIVRIVVVLARVGRAADRALGDGYTYRLVNRLRNAIVESISGAVTVAVLDEVQAVMSRGHYAQNIARAMQENQQELRAMIAQKLAEDRQAGRLARLPFARELTESVIDTALRVVEEVLKDPRTDELISDMLRENLLQIRASVQARTGAGPTPGTAILTEPRRP